MSKPLVSIIIVNWNGGQTFSRCLVSLSKINYQKWELIVVDNGSTDDSIEQVQNFKLPYSNFQLIQNKTNLGFATANNQGYKLSSGKYILLLNNDTEVNMSFLKILVEKMESDRSIGVIQPKIFMFDKKGYLDNAGSFFTRIGFFEHWGFGKKDGPDFTKEREILSAKGACMLIRSSVIEKVGLFDRDFFSYFEETDFCWRVWLSGSKVLFYPQAYIKHKIGYTIRRLSVFDLNYHYYKNRITSLIKNLELSNLCLILPIHFLILLGIFMFLFIRLQFRHSFLIAKALFWNIINLQIILEKRKLVQKLRRVSDKKLFKELLHPIHWREYFQNFRRIEEDLNREV